MFSFRAWLRRLSYLVLSSRRRLRLRRGRRGSWLSRGRGPRRLRPADRYRQSAAWPFEKLEPIALLSGSTFNVSNTADSGAGSLRQAILDTDVATQLPVTINFNISTGDSGYGVDSAGVWTISPHSALPSLTVPVTIDGTSQPGYAGTPVIEINGTSAGSVVNGLTVGSGGGGSTIEGLIVGGFTGNGIELDAGGNTLENNYIGTNAAGTAALANGTNGIELDGSSNNTIGGTNTNPGGSLAGAGNLISANAHDGILISGAAATANTVSGNFIGTDVTGTVAVGNGSSGVEITDGSSNTIGGASPGARNIISGNLALSANSGDGVELDGTNSGNTIEGNYVGTDATGNNAIPNFFGVFVTGGSDNLIGGAQVGARNVISGNVSRQMQLSGGDGTTVAGNYVGLDPTGTFAVGGTAYAGVELRYGSNYTIGGGLPGAGNVISGNQIGINVYSSVTADVLGNYIGTDASSENGIGNSTEAVGIDVTDLGGGDPIVIGGTLPGDRNIIRHNAYANIQLDGSGTEVEGNFIGIDAEGLNISGGSNGAGVYITGTGNIVGGTTPGARNIISGNGTGVYLAGGASGNSIENNYIGTDPSGSSAVGNVDGIQLAGASNNNITGNVISGNSSQLDGYDSANKGEGVWIDSASSGNTVAGNFIGTNAAGTAAVRNGWNGIVVAGSDNTIGGTTAAARNVISGNAVDGVLALGDANNTIEGNYLGTDVTGTVPVANETGIELAELSAGDTVKGNLISGNSSDGVTIDGSHPWMQALADQSAATELVGWWPGEGNANDASGNNDNGTAVGNVSYVAGKVGEAFHFDGSGAAVVVPHNATTDLTGDLTISAWIDPASTTSGILVAQGNGDDYADAYQLRYGNGDDGALLLAVSDGGTAASYYATAPGVVPVGVYSHVVVTVQGTVATFYVNGAVVPGQYTHGSGSPETIVPATAITTNRFSDGGSFRIGARADSFAPFNGAIDEVQVYDSALSAAQVQQLYNLAAGEIVAGNYIGTKASGTGALANGGDGVDIIGRSNNTIGGTTAGARNVIAGNTNDGVLVTGASATGNVVEGNYVGNNAYFLSEYQIPTAASTPADIANGPDGNLWFTESDANKIARITTGGTITEFAVPTSSSYPNAITAGPDGNLWFTENNADKIGRLTTSGTFSEFSIPSPGIPTDITTGPDGNLWFTQYYGDNIGRITTSGVITLYPIPTSGGHPSHIVSGPDGNLWFAESDGSNIGRITTSGVITEFTLPTPDAGPVGITVGPDGNLWFAEQYVSQFGKITTSGVITEYPAPANSQPYGITVGSDGNLWFTEQGSQHIGRLTVNGTVTEFFAGRSLSIVTGPDGNLWFPERDSNKVATFSLGTAIANGANGVAIVNGPENNIIGGSTAGAGNVISGNAGEGIYVDATSSATTIAGNFVGTTVAGTDALANGTNGVEIDGANNTVGGVNTNPGGTLAGAGNLISRNTQNGVYITGASATGNVVEGNYIGTDVTGNAALGNAQAGVEILAASSNIIGGVAAGEGNLISANKFIGVYVDGGGSYTSTLNNVIEGNLVGTNASGTTTTGVNGSGTLGNGGSGISISNGASQATVGGSVSGAGNVVAGSSHIVDFFGDEGDGIFLGGSVNDVIEGNYIGTDITGAHALANASAGVEMANASSVRMGNDGTGAADAIERNVISGNIESGMLIESTGGGSSTNDIVQGNYIGLDATGESALPNGLYGVELQSNVTGTRVGSAGDGVDDAGERNVISGNTFDGVYLDAASGAFVAGNYIGLDAAGATAIGNGNQGVWINGGAANNRIGANPTDADPAGERNVISGNARNGVYIGVGNGNFQTNSDNVVAGNYIGTNAAGTAAIANGASGVSLNGAGANTIGGTAAAARNVIAGNSQDGVLITGSSATGNTVEGNTIGATGTGAPVITEFATPTPGSVPEAITTGPDGNLWFVEHQVDKIGRRNPDGTITEFTVPAALDFPDEIVNGPDGNLWIVCAYAIGRMTTSGTFTVFPIPNSDINGLTVGPDGNLWFGEEQSRNVGRITPSGVITEFPMPDGASPGYFVTGPDGNLWFTVGGSFTIGRITTAGVITEFHNASASDTNLEQITVGPDGNLWFTAMNSDFIGKITTSGVFTDYPVPTPNSSPYGITVGPDGNLWFTEQASDKIGRITPSGTVTEFSVPTPGAVPDWFTIGPDGNLWFTEENGNNIARLVLTLNVGNGADGVALVGGATNNTIGGATGGAGNVISGNVADGVYVDATSSTNTIAGNFIGTTPAGTAALANGTNGVEIDGPNNTIGGTNTNPGGTLAGAGNLISGNTGDGVYLNGASATANTISGNFIGTDVTGAIAVGNGSNGVEITDGSNNTVGGTTAAARNIISGNIPSPGNSGDGVKLDGASNNNTIEGNYIGTDVGGTVAVANANGVALEFETRSNVIGGGADGAGNVISGNTGAGIGFDDNGLGGHNVLAGNFIGTNAGGSASLPNNVGVSMNHANQDTVGGASPGARNIISGNRLGGMSITDAAVSGAIEGNYIGTDVTGEQGLGNGGSGISLFVSEPMGIDIPDALTIGGAAAGDGNVISDNATFGIDIAGVTNIAVEGNYIGTDASGTRALGNGTYGVEIGPGNYGSTGGGNTIGGLLPGDRNVISSNAFGVFISGGAGSNTIEGNFIGTNATGTAVLANTTGIELNNASNDTIGGTTVAAQNVITGNSQDGVLITGASATGNMVEGNTIGATTSAPATITEYPVPTPASYPDAIATGSDGNLWFIEHQTNKAARRNSDGTITEFNLPATINFPDSDMVNGPDGNLWFAGSKDVIARLTTSGSVTVFATPTPSSYPNGFAVGPDGNIWFTEYYGNRIGRITPAGTITEYLVPGTVHPTFITAGPDGNLWFTVAEHEIGRITTTGSITLFNLTESLGPPEGITVGPDNNLWFVEGNNADQVGKMTTSGVVTYYTVPDHGGGDAIAHIVTGPDGNLWFTEENTNFIGRITPAGAVTEVPVPTPGAGADRIVIGPDGNLWFTGITGNNLARLVINLPGNGVNGVEISGGASGNTIGGTTAAGANVISGNHAAGILTANDSQNVIEGNFIGTDPTGTTAVANATGVNLSDFSSGDTVNRNVISGNTGDGVTINGQDAANGLAGWWPGEGNASDTSGNGNNGTLVGGTTFAPGKVGQAFDFNAGQNQGVDIPSSATFNPTQDLTLAAWINPSSLPNTGPTILRKDFPGSGNAQYELTLGDGVTAGRIGFAIDVGGIDHGIFDQGPTIPLNAWSDIVGTYDGHVFDLYINGSLVASQSGSFSIGTGSGPLMIGREYQDTTRSFDGLIDEAQVYDSALTATQVQQLYNLATGETIAGNYIGTNAAGTAALANGGDGVDIVGRSSSTIGGTTSTDRNIISGNTGDGIFITGATAVGNVVEGDYLGTSSAGTDAVGNGSNGIGISGASSTIIGGTNTNPGGTLAGAGNLISGNASNGVLATDAVGTLIEGNFVGLNVAGTAALQNDGDGIDMNVGSDNTVGGTTAAMRNVISGNNSEGHKAGVDSGGESGDLIEGNYIGTNAAGNAAIANANAVILQAGSTNVLVGGTAPGAVNVIGGSEILIDATSSQNTIAGNLIGTDATGKVALANNGAGLNILGDDNTIGGTTAAARNVISSHTGVSGVILQGMANTVEGNYIGTDITATAALPNGVGVQIDGGSNNIVGGTTSGAANVISDNKGDGVLINNFPSPGPASGNTIEGNFIGTDPTGSAARANAANGVEIDSASNNTVSGNVISGNRNDGVYITGNAPATMSNLPGGLVAWYQAQGNTNDTSGNNNTGTAVGTVNYTAGDLGQAFSLSGASGNYVSVPDNASLDLTGQLTMSAWISMAASPAVGNDDLILTKGTSGGQNYSLYVTNLGHSAVYHSNANGTNDLELVVVTSNGATTERYVSSNSDLYPLSGVYFDVAVTLDGSTVSFYVDGKLVSQSSQTAALAANSSPFFIGGDSDAANNTFNGSITDVQIYSQALSASQVQAIVGADGTPGNTISGNLIGTNAAGTAALANGQDGVGLNNSANNTIGGTTAATRNTISGNAAYGVHITGLASSGNLIEGNYIGTSADGSAALGNQQSGIYATAGGANTIGGLSSTPGTGAGNVISANGFRGIDLLSQYGDVLEGNIVGLNAPGSDAFGTPTNDDPQGGISLHASAQNTIGGGAAGARNVVSGTGVGVYLYATTIDTTVQGNFVGTDITGQNGIGNNNAGVWIQGAADSTVGGTTPGAGNVIAYNNGNGIAVRTGNSGYPALNNSLRDNSIFGNVDLGIDLKGTSSGAPSDTPLLNDSAGHVGPNDYQNFPLITAESSDGSTTSFSGTLQAATNTRYTIDFFANPASDPSQYGQGQTYLGSTTVNTDSNGAASFSNVAFTFNGTPAANGGQQPIFSATATDPAGNTSEFGPDYPTPNISVAIEAPSTASEGAEIQLTSSVTDHNVVGTNSGVTFSYHWTVSTPSGSVLDLGPDATQPTLTLHVLNAGIYTITLTVTDSEGAAGQATASMSVSAPAPTLVIQSQPQTANGQPGPAPGTGIVGTPINLQGAVLLPAGDTIVSYNWSVSDGSGHVVASATSALFSFTPATAGNYSVTLAATDAAGYSAKAIDAVLVTSSTPVAAITGLPTAAVEGTPISLANTITSGSFSSVVR